DEYVLTVRPRTERGWGPAYSWTRANVPLTALSLTPSLLGMTAGETVTLSADPMSADALHPAVTWSSSDPAVASVSSDGTVTAIATGDALLTATSVRYPDITATCEVSVKADLSGIGDTAADTVSVTGLPGRIVVEGAVAGDITVYLPTGATVAVRPAAPRVAIPLPAGAYLVSVNATLHKVAVR
ncbi:MAG: Ig-like domain-containing protein, partial [Pseudoflavonifractor sp.]|nr:Ig-like domain-containing protein [Pseudoflavonifractor sp.]